MENHADKFYDQHNMHRMRVNLNGHSLATPLKTKLDTSISWACFIAPSATVAGNVEIWDQCSLWYGVVVKADVNLIRIGAFTNIQDNTTIREALAPLDDVHDGSCVIGHYVTVGHGCHLTACTIEDECMVGMGSILKEGSYMEKMSMLAAGSVLEAGARVPTGELWAGSPAKPMRHLTAEEQANFRKHAKTYWWLANDHKRQFLPMGIEYIEAEEAGHKVGWKGRLDYETRFAWQAPKHRVENSSRGL